MNEENYYDILGVEKNANSNDIKKAYRSLSLKYHPDRNKDESATETYKKINMAYETLSDDDKKRQYDMERQHGGNPFMFPGHQGHPGHGDFNDLNNIFNMMFQGGVGGMPGMPGGIHATMHGHPNIRVFSTGPGGVHHQFHTGGFPHMMRPEKIGKNIHISLEDAYNGITFPVDISYYEVQNNSRENKNETIYIKIPPGIDNNEGIEVSDKGNIVNGLCGGVKITINVNGHPFFKRKGLDLHYYHNISLKEALTGFKLEIPHLNGKKIGLNNTENPNIIKPGFVKVAQGYGMKRENATGNLLIEFNINFPENLTNEQIQTLQDCL